MAEDSREAHRADFHQVLASAALFDAAKMTVTLVYPLRRSTYEALRHADALPRERILHSVAGDSMLSCAACHSGA